jgi:hypothetical protein
MGTSGAGRRAPGDADHLPAPPIAAPSAAHAATMSRRARHPTFPSVSHAHQLGDSKCPLGPNNAQMIHPTNAPMTAQTTDVADHPPRAEVRGCE